jgi:hypothetical protein
MGCQVPKSTEKGKKKRQRKIEAGRWRQGFEGV